MHCSGIATSDDIGMVRIEAPILVTTQSIEDGRLILILTIDISLSTYVIGFSVFGVICLLRTTSSH